MSCVFKHKESKINTLSELKEQDILDGPYIKSGKDEQFNQYHNDLIESVQENYNLGIDKFFNVLEQKTTGLFGIVKKFVQPIDSSFKQLDQARKDLGIYDSKESYLSFKEAAEAKSIKLDEISNIKPGVPELFESNSELANAVYEAVGFNNFTNQEKEQLIEQLRNPLFDLVRGTELYNKYKGETIPYGYSENSWKLLISGINESKLDLNKILLGYKKRLLEEENTPIRETGIDEKTGLPKGFNPSTGEFEGGFGELSEKENAINKSKQKIAVLEKLINQKQQAQQLYSQYLDTVFPDSKVKDIVYHGTGEFNAKEILRYGFDKSLQGENKVFYFTVDKKDSFGSLGGIVSAIVNIEKLFNNRFSSLLDRDENSDSFYFPTETDINSAIYNSVAKRNPGNIFKDIKGNISEVSVIEPEQIHILGGKQDIEGFKSYIQNKQSVTPRQGISELFTENPQLASIGTQEQYERYLSTIFPSSKMKDIVYRGGNLGTKQPQDVEAFTTNKSYAEYRAEQNNTKVYPSILNIQESKLLEKKETRTISLDRDEFQYQDYGFTDNKDQTKQLGNFYTVKENNRHILGNKQDIEEFKKFVGKEETKFDNKSNIDISLLNEDIGIKLDINTLEGAAFINAINNGDIESTNCK